MKSDVMKVTFASYILGKFDYFDIEVLPTTAELFLELPYQISNSIELVQIWLSIRGRVTRSNQILGLRDAR